MLLRIFNIIIAGLFIAAFFYLVKLIHNYKKGKNVKDIGVVAGYVLTLAVALFSISNAYRTISTAERTATIQSRPYVYLDGAMFKVYEDMRNKDDKHCEYFLFLKNSGNIPASNVLIDLEISYKNNAGGIFTLSTYRDDKDVVKINADKKPFTIATGNLSRISKGTLWINKEDADPINQARKQVYFHVIITYSAPGYSNKWTYEVKGSLLDSLPFQIEYERIL